MPEGRGQLPESQLNDLLRRVDWRFLLRCSETPRIANLAGGADAAAIDLIGAEAAGPHAADVAVIGFPTRRGLNAALGAVRAGGEVVCLWRTPRVGGVRRASRRLRQAGLEDVQVFWPGPLPHRTPQFWLPLESPTAAAHLLAKRPPRSPVQSALRPLWRGVARAGLPAPLCAIGSRPEEGRSEPDEIERVFPAAGERWLLSGGGRSINKVIGLPLDGDGGDAEAIVKFSRVPAADAALGREAAVLRAMERERPAVSGVPRLLGQGRRAGRLALAESAVHGRPLIETLEPESFGALGRLVADWLIDLVDRDAPRARSVWWPRLVGEPLTRFEAEFGAAAPAGLLTATRSRLEGLGDLPGACEHRDCSPWNVVLRQDGTLGLLDWESAEPNGLPGLDLAYFLANAAFILDGALDSGRTAESYTRLLDPSDPRGIEADRCSSRYCRAVGIEPEQLARLRLLAWIVHSHSDFRHLEMAAAGAPSPEALRRSTYLGLIRIELERDR